MDADAELGEALDRDAYLLYAASQVADPASPVPKGALSVPHVPADFEFEDPAVIVAPRV